MPKLVEPLEPAGGATQIYGESDDPIAARRGIGEPDRGWLLCPFHDERAVIARPEEQRRTAKPMASESLRAGSRTVRLVVAE